MAPTIQASTRRWLLAAARRAVAQALGDIEPQDGAELPPAPEDRVLDQPARVFVSWHKGPRLLGCIGTLEARMPLREAVPHYAVAAGLHDPRLPAMDRNTLDQSQAEISVLAEPVELPQTGFAAIAAAIVPRQDGVVVSRGPHRAVFLPVVWEALPDPQEFLAALCRKAGIVSPAQADDLRAKVFGAQSWSDDD